MPAGNEDKTLKLDIKLPSSGNPDSTGEYYMLEITPVDVAPDVVVQKLQKGGSRLVMLGDANHNEYSIKTIINGMLDSPRSKPGHFFIEMPNDPVQAVYDQFANAKTPAEEANMRSVVKQTAMFRLAGIDPELMKTKLATELHTYEITRKNKIAVHMIDDHSDKNKMQAAQTTENRFEEFRVNSALTKYMVDNKLDKALKAASNEKEIEIVLAAVPQELQIKGFYVSDPEIVKTQPKERLRTNGYVTKPEDQVVAFMYFAPDAGVTFATKKTQVLKALDETMKSAGISADEKTDSVGTKLETKKKQLADVFLKAMAERDNVRDTSMADRIIKALDADKTATGIGMVGFAHIDGKKEKGRNDPELDERLKSKEGLSPSHIDIFPVAQDTLKLLGKVQKFNGIDCVVCVGGVENADYTIFVPGNIEWYGLRKYGEIDADKGPHKEKLEKLKISTLIDGKENGFKKMDLALLHSPSSLDTAINNLPASLRNKGTFIS